jgi:hypothetical protein
VCGAVLLSVSGFIVRAIEPPSARHRPDCTTRSGFVVVAPVSIMAVISRWSASPRSVMPAHERIRVILDHSLSLVAFT